RARPAVSDGRSAALSGSVAVVTAVARRQRLAWGGGRAPRRSRGRRGALDQARRAAGGAGRHGPGVTRSRRLRRLAGSDSLALTGAGDWVGSGAGRAAPRGSPGGAASRACRGTAVPMSDLTDGGPGS